jgi:hypothetical protein
MSRVKSMALPLLILLTIGQSAAGDATPPWVRSVRDGRWSDTAAWESGRLPAAGPGFRSGPGTRNPRVQGGVGPRLAACAFSLQSGS